MQGKYKHRVERTNIIVYIVHVMLINDLFWKYNKQDVAPSVWILMTKILNQLIWSRGLGYPIYIYPSELWCN